MGCKPYRRPRPCTSTERHGARRGLCHAGLLRVKRRLDPLHLSLDQDRIEAAWRRRCVAQQVVARGKHHPLLLDCTDAGARTAKGIAAAAAHFHKHHRTVTFAQDEVDLAPSAPWRSIIALQQLQALRLQIRQRLVFGSIAALAGGGVCRSARGGGPFSKEFH